MVFYFDFGGKEYRVNTEFRVNQRNNFFFTLDRFSERFQWKTTYQAYKIPLSHADLANPNYVPADNIQNGFVRYQNQVSALEVDVEFEPSSVIESWSVTIGQRADPDHRTFTRLTWLFNLFRNNLNIANAINIRFWGSSTSPHVEDIQRFVVGHAAFAYNLYSDTNTREVIQITQGEGDDRTGYGFSRAPEVNGQNIRVNMTFPPSQNYVSTDVVEYAIIPKTKIFTAISKHVSVKGMYFQNIDIARSQLGDNIEAIRRRIVYPNGYEIRSKWYTLDLTRQKYYADDDVKGSASGVVSTPDSPVGVYDKVNIDMPEIDFGRTV